MTNNPRRSELFREDNFASRRTTGHNLYDPESTITEGELRRGMTYLNSRAVYHGGPADSPDSYHREFIEPEQPYDRLAHLIDD